MRNADAGHKKPFGNVWYTIGLFFWVLPGSYKKNSETVTKSL